MAEEGGFEPPVRVDPARLFSKQLVSATHPLLQVHVVYRLPFIVDGILF
jgi:hypothetical protein